MSLALYQEERTKYRETRLGDEKYESIPLLKKLANGTIETFSRIQICTFHSKFFSCFLIVIGYSQIISILYNPTLELGMEDGISWPIFSYATNVGVFGLMTGSDSGNWYYIISYIFCLFIMLHAIIFLVIFNDVKNTYTKLAYLLSEMNATIYWALFIPICETLLMVYKCDSGKLLVDDRTSCKSTSTKFHKVLFTCFALIFSVQTLLISIFGNSMNPYDANDKLARFHWNFELHFLFIRALLIILSCMVPKSTTRNGFILWPLEIFCISHIYKTYVCRPYYIKAVEVTFEISIWSLFWISTVFAINEVVTKYFEYNYNGASILIYIGLLGVLKQIHGSTNIARSLKVLSVNKNYIENEEDFNKLICTLLSLIQPKGELSNIERIIFEGYLMNHFSQCQRVKCPLNNITNTYYLAVTDETSQPKYYDTVMLLHFIRAIFYNIALQNESKKGILNENVDKIWQRILLSYTYFCIYKTGNLHAAIVMASQAKQSDPGLILQAEIVKINLIIENRINVQNSTKKTENNKKVFSIDPRTLLEYESKFFHFKELVLHIAEKYREIWNQLLSPIPDLNLVQKNFEQVIFKISEVKKIRDGLSAIHPNYSKSDLAYEMFLIEILGRTEMIDGNINMNKELCTDLDIEQYKANCEIFENDSTVIAVSAMPDTYGTILKASNGFLKIFEYEPSEIIGKSVNIIIPQFIADSHNKYVSEYFESARKRVIDKRFTTIACDKQQYLLEVNLLLMEFYDSIYGSILVCLIKMPQQKTMVATNSKGVILGITRNATKWLNATLTPTLVKENEIKIQKICTNVDWSTEDSYETFIGNKELSFNFIGSSTGITYLKDDPNMDYKKLEQVNVFQKMWKCNIENYIRRDIMLKLFIFKGKPRNFEEQSFTSDLGEKLNTNKIDIKLDVYGQNSFLSPREGMYSESGLSPRARIRSKLGMCSNAALSPRRGSWTSFRMKKMKNIIPPSPHARTNEPQSFAKAANFTDKMGEAKNVPIQITLNQSTENILQDNDENKMNAEPIDLDNFFNMMELVKNTDYKKYIPPIQKYIMRVMLFYFLLLATSIFLYTLCSLKCVSTSDLIRGLLMTNRETNIIEISEAVRTLLLLNDDLDGNPMMTTDSRSNYNFEPDDGEIPRNYTEWKFQRLKNASSNLKIQQRYVNENSFKFASSKTKVLVNPSSVTSIIPSLGVNVNQTYAFNTFINMFVNIGTKIAKLPLKSIKNTTDSIIFMLNTKYTYIIDLNFDNESFLNDVDYIQDICKLVMIAVAISMLIVGIGMMVLVYFALNLIVKYNVNNADLFLKIKKKQINEQIFHCGEFLRFMNFSDEDHDTINGYQQSLNNNGGKEEKKLDKKEIKANRKSKNYEYKSTIWKFVVVIVIGYVTIEAVCFILYFYEIHLSNKMHKHLEILIMLKKQAKIQPRYFGLLIDTFYAASIRDFSVIDTIIPNRGYLYDGIGEHQTLLKLTVDNEKFFSQEYNEVFHKISFDTVCDERFVRNMTECKYIDDGILDMGLYSTNMKLISRYLDKTLNFLSNAFEITLDFLREYLNSHDLVINEYIMRKYQCPIVSKLIAYLNQSSKNAINTGKICIILLCISASIVVFMICVILWRIYFMYIRYKIFTAQISLCYIPIDVITSTEDIVKYFTDMSKEIISNTSKKPATWIA